MKKIQLLILTIVCFNLSIAQKTRKYDVFQVEAFSGANHIHHHQCTLENKSIHRGLTMPAGLRFNFNLSEHWSIIPGIAMNHMIGDNLKFPAEKLVKLDVKFSTGHWDQLLRWDFNIEVGVERIYNFKRTKIPLYLGTQFQLNSLFDIYCRIRIPTMLESFAFGTLNMIESSFELGIAINTCTPPIPKFSSTSGNPFILE